MATIPVAWLISIFALLLTAIVLRQIRLPTVARLCFGLGLLSIAVVAVFVGVRFQFKGASFVGLQPYLGTITAPSLWLGFQSLTTQSGSPSHRTVAVTAVAVLTSWIVIAVPYTWTASFAVILINIFYSGCLFHLVRSPAEAFIHVASYTYPTVRKAIIGCLAFFSFVIVVDTGVLAMGFAAGEAQAMQFLSNAALAIVLVMTLGLFIALSLIIGPSKIATENESKRTQPLKEDREVFSRLEALMTETALFRDPELTVARIGRRLGVPARAVSVSVNRLTGENTTRYINSFRIRHALHLLESSSLSVTDIMLESGFVSKSSFNTEFRRITGQTPSDHRKAHRSKISTVRNPTSERSSS